MTFYQELAEALTNQEKVALVTVIRSAGSVPRGEGARLAVFQDGRTIGTVGGGMIEYKGIERAKTLLAQSELPGSLVEPFQMNNEEAAKQGMVCGGEATLYTQFFCGTDAAAFFQKTAEAQEEDEDLWLAFLVQEGSVPALKAYRANCEVAILGDTSAFPADPKESSGSLFVESLATRGKVLVFGGGHVAQALVPVLQSVDFRVLVYEDRAEYLTHAHFPEQTELVLGDITSIDDAVAIRPQDFIVITTRGHLGDLDVLRQALQHQTRYLGMIGSRKKVKTLFDHLKEQGVSEEALKRVYAPIGVSIAAETPAEIAISIAAEMVRVRATGK